MPNGKNLRLKINPLFKDIYVDKSKFKIKSNSATIVLKKKGSDYWSDIKEKNEKLGKMSKKAGDDLDSGKKDPNGALMDMMKDLYKNVSMTTNSRREMMT
jgi:thymidylate synthase